ncbi:similar to Metaxin 1, isoform 2, isoform CRA_c [Rattus norvegicus]|uniref:Similar to Metaxin 1, isoform 2, isoform CRA_c n=1 Tax=Rattus norvegicus TaxID=10116 RepID=A6J6C8_RAT|nr:similar to Metaxin 1, isoform 2, isoform CRA_c [Rattus norvegicus]
MQLTCHRLHARHQQALRPRRNHTGGGPRFYLCWQGWQPWWAMPCSVALFPSSVQALLGPHAHRPWTWLRRMKRTDVLVPRTDFSIHAFQMPLCPPIVGAAKNGVLSSE